MKQTILTVIAGRLTDAGMLTGGAYTHDANGNVTRDGLSGLYIWYDDLNPDSVASMVGELCRTTSSATATSLATAADSVTGVSVFYPNGHLFP